VDTGNGELVVANGGIHSITVYARTASGDTPPLRTIAGPATGLNGPGSLALDTGNNELVVANGGNNSITVYSRTASGNTAPLRTITGPATGLNGPGTLALDTGNNELFVTNINVPSITVYPRTASGNTAPLRTITGPAGKRLIGPHLVAVTTTGAPLALVALNSGAFVTGQLTTYQATLSPGSPPSQVDVYLGALLPDGVTFLSLVQVSPGEVTVVLGSSPIPFQANVALAQSVIPFSYRFAGFEPPGTYFTYAGLAVAGSNPFVPANQLSLAVQPFQFAQ
jgi:hypothetical protein